jgi:ribonuclease-3 family protein
MYGYYVFKGGRRMNDLLSEAVLTVTEAKMKNPLALAYVGDTVWDLLVRRRLLKSNAQAGTLHKRAVAQVNAGAQAAAFARIEGFLTEAESDIARRGGNAHAHHAAPKNQDPFAYSRATGLEALFGYLYLSGQEERIAELFALAQPPEHT